MYICIYICVSRSIYVGRSNSAIGYGRKIHRLNLCRGVKHPHQRVPRIYTKSAVGKALVLQLWKLRSTPSYPLLPGRLWFEIVVAVRVLSIDQIELFNYFLFLKLFICVESNDYYQVKLFLFDWNTWNHLTKCKYE